MSDDRPLLRSRCPAHSPVIDLKRGRYAHQPWRPLNLPRYCAIPGEVHYAHTRAASVFRRASRTTDHLFQGELRIAHPAERQLALDLLEFDREFDTALEKLSPQVLCAYAYTLARQFTRFYEQCTILDEQHDDTTAESRLELCQLAAKHLTLTLALLGIETADHM